MKSFAQIQKKTEGLLAEFEPKDILIALDIDHTLIQPKHKASHFSSSLSHGLEAHPFIKALTKEEQDVIITLVNNDEGAQIIDPNSLSFVNFLQDKKIPLIGYTAIALIEPKDQEETTQRRTRILASLGFDFSKNCTYPDQILNEFESYLGKKPLFEKGILYTHGTFSDSKKEVLKAFLNKNSLSPKVIVIIDDEIPNTEDSQESDFVSARLIRIHARVSYDLDEPPCTLEEFKSFWLHKFYDAKNYLSYVKQENSEKTEKSIQSYLSKKFHKIYTIKPLAKNLQQETYLLDSKDKKSIAKVISVSDSFKTTRHLLNTFFQTAFFEKILNFILRMGVEKGGFRFFQEKENTDVKSSDLLRYYSFHFSIYKDLCKKISMPSLHEGANFIHFFDKKILILYNFSSKKEKKLSEITLEEKLKIAEALGDLHTLDLKNFPQDAWKIKRKLYLNMFKSMERQNIFYHLALIVRKILNTKNLDDFVLSSGSFENLEINYLTAQDLVFSHNDLKPKNVLWDEKGKFEIIDWDEILPVSQAGDFIDTVTSWCVEKTEPKYTLNHTETELFFKKYKEHSNLSLKITASNIKLSAFKWLYWLLTCEVNKKESEISEACKMIELLYNEQEYLISLSK